MKSFFSIHRGSGARKYDHGVWIGFGIRDWLRLGSGLGLHWGWGCDCDWVLLGCGHVVAFGLGLGSGWGLEWD